MLDDDRLRRLYQRATRAATDAGEHPDEETWERLAAAELGPAGRRRAIDHLTRCPDCARIYRALSLLEEEAPGIDGERPALEASMGGGSRRPASRFLWPALAAAALVLLVVLPAGPPSDDSDRSGVDPLRRASGEVRPRPLSPIGPTSGAATSLTWEATPGAAFYRVELLDADGELLWESPEVQETAVAWPSGLAGESGRYYWRVLALPERGGEPVASELVAFDVTPSRN